MHFRQQFLPPAPFQFIVLNKDLETEQNKDFIIRVKTEGKIIPEKAMIFIGNESYFMETIKTGEFQFKIENPAANVSFHVEANSVSSPDYELNVIAVPSIANFEMQLNFPSYLNRKPELIKGNGNAVIPEGTRVFWKIKALATQRVEWSDFASNFLFFEIKRRLFFRNAYFAKYSIPDSNFEWSSKKLRKVKLSNFGNQRSVSHH